MKSEMVDFYIIHQRKYKESSLLLSIFTKEYGKLSVIFRVPKKQANLYQPLSVLRGELVLAKKDSSLSKLYNVELISSFYQKSYILLLSLQYMNELIYLLLDYSHEEYVLFEKYEFIIENINESNYKYLLRVFELELLETLGQAICCDADVLGIKIVPDNHYKVSYHGFVLELSKSAYSISGESISKISLPLSSWSDQNLKDISRITRLFIDNCLGEKELKSRKLLLDYLRLKH